METFGEMKNELRSRLMASTGNSTFNDQRLGELINSAYRWAASLFPWEELKRAKETLTVAGQEYYDYPEEFQTNSIVRLEVDGEPYEKYSFDAYLDFKQNNPSTDEKIFSEYGRQIFIYPIPQVDGKKIVVWGYIQPPKLVNDNDKTFFYNFDIAGNEAIVNKALSTILLTVDPTKAKELKSEALEILSVIWNDMKQRSATAKPKGKQFFNIPNFFGKSNVIGKFNK